MEQEIGSKKQSTEQAEHERILRQVTCLFEANPYTVNTARQIAIRLRMDIAQIESCLEQLVQTEFIQLITYPGSTVYRHIPNRE